MNKIKNLQRNTKTNKWYLIVKQYLDRYGIRVARWMPYENEVGVVQYLADIEERRVWIPFPQDEYSFYICMHEIGHIVTGPRRYAYLQEFQAEQYALRKCRQYKVLCSKTVEEAKSYVRSAIAEDVLFRGLNPKDVHPIIRRWIGCSSADFLTDSLSLGERFQELDPASIVDVRNLSY